MRLKTQKLLLNLATLATLLFGLAGLVALIVLPVGLDLEETGTLTANTASSVVNGTDVGTDNPHLNVNSPVWTRSWRQPLYDPPPPAPVAAAPRPITVKLMGTIIEPNNSQAFLQTSSGSVELKKLGDQVTSDPEDGTISAITSSEITIKRTDGEHQLKVAP